MSDPKSAVAAAVEQDPVLAALESAPLDSDALTPAEAEELSSRMAKGHGRGRSSDEVLAEIEERSKREG